MSVRQSRLLALPILLLLPVLAPVRAGAQPPPPAPPPAALPAMPPDILAGSVFAPYTPSHCGVTSGVLLTIDDFPAGNGALVEQVAALAQQQGIMMEGFPIEKYVLAFKQATGVDLVARARARHMYMSNHTYDHKQLTRLSDAMVSYEIRYGNHSTYLRPPYGSYNARVKNIAESLGYRICTWNIDTNDWRKINGQYPSVNTIRNRIFAQLSAFQLTPGTAIVILGHYYTNYPAALRYIPGDLRARGYKLCPLPAAPTTATVPFPICSV